MSRFTCLLGIVRRVYLYGQLSLIFHRDLRITNESFPRTRRVDETDWWSIIEWKLTAMPCLRRTLSPLEGKRHIIRADREMEGRGVWLETLFCNWPMVQYSMDGLRATDYEIPTWSTTLPNALLCIKPRSAPFEHISAPRNGLMVRLDSYKF